MSEAPTDLDSIFAEVTHKKDGCPFTTLPPAAQAWVRNKIAEAEAASKPPPWMAMGRTLSRAGFVGFEKPHKLDVHFLRGHET